MTSSAHNLTVKLHVDASELTAELENVMDSSRAFVAIAIMGGLAESNPVVVKDDDMWARECALCGETAISHKDVVHATGCLWLRAKKLVEG